MLFVPRDDESGCPAVWHHGWSRVEWRAADRCIQRSHLYSGLCCGPPRGSRRARIILRSLVDSILHTLAAKHRMTTRLPALSFMFLRPPLFSVSCFNRRPRCRLVTYLRTLSFFYDIHFWLFSLLNTHTCKILLCNHRRANLPGDKIGFSIHWGFNCF